MGKQPLYPHVPKSKEVLFPHVPGGERVTALPKAEAVAPALPKAYPTRRPSPEQSLKEVETYVESKYAVEYKLAARVEEEGWETALALNISEGEVTPEQLDKILTRAKNPVKMIEQAQIGIGTTLGNLVATYRYESIEDGKGYEAYLDSLIEVIEKHQEKHGLPYTPLRARIAPTA